MMDSAPPTIPEHIKNSLLPLRFNPSSGEPYIPIPGHPKIIITPPRLSDVPLILSYMNDPSVYMNLANPPYPYRIEHAEQWLRANEERCRKCLEECVDAFGSQLEGKGEGTGESPGAESYVGWSPVQSLREVLPDGTDVFLGDVSVRRTSFFHVIDEQEAARLTEENDARPVGDPEIVWAFGDYLAPSHHGRGIMTAAIKVMKDEWMIPKMGARKIVVDVMKGNVGSVRVFEKNGFKLTETIDDCKVMQESKGGGSYGLHVLEWKFE